MAGKDRSNSTERSSHSSHSEGRERASEARDSLSDHAKEALSSSNTKDREARATAANIANAHTHDMPNGLGMTDTQAYNTRDMAREISDMARRDPVGAMDVAAALKDQLPAHVTNDVFERVAEKVETPRRAEFTLDAQLDELPVRPGVALIGLIPNPWLSNGLTRFAASVIGDPLAAVGSVFRKDGLGVNPLTRQILSERQLQDAKFMAVVDTATLGIGRGVSTAARSADEIIMRDSLQELIEMNKTRFPEVFNE